jgi:hypothetical protein
MGLAGPGWTVSGTADMEGKFTELFRRATRSLHIAQGLFVKPLPNWVVAQFEDL